MCTYNYVIVYPVAGPAFRLPRHLYPCGAPPGGQYGHAGERGPLRRLHAAQPGQGRGRVPGGQHAEGVAVRRPGP